MTIFEKFDGIMRNFQKSKGQLVDIFETLEF